MSSAPTRFARLGFAVAAIVFVLDQALKAWFIAGFDLGAKGVVKVMPGLELVLTWNTGISYGLFQQDSPVGRWLLIAIMVLAVILLSLWLRRTQGRLTAIALGLIIGGALGNAVDRLIFGAVADFILIYLAGTGWRFDWYVFNLADATIVAGVVGLMYESLFPERAAKAP
jgi:signal peptidase II